MDTNPVMEKYVHDLKEKLDKRFTLTVFDNENVIEKFKESLINKYERDMQTFITQNIPAYITPETNAVLYSTAVERHYTEYCRDLLYADPETGDIDDINGYLRDARTFNEQAQMARKGLRLDLTRADTKKAPSSAVVQEFLQREKALEEEYKTDVPETERVLKKYVFETEHVLEVSVVAHMINNEKFKAAVENHLGRHYMETGNLSAMDTLAALAVTLKEQQNLVGKVPDDFNGHKGRFFQGKDPLSVTLARYLEERSAIQGPWIAHHAAHHENPFVRYVFSELSKTRFAKGGWYNLIGQLWWVTKN